MRPGTRGPHLSRRVLCGGGLAGPDGRIARTCRLSATAGVTFVGIFVTGYWVLWSSQDHSRWGSVVRIDLSNSTRFRIKTRPPAPLQAFAHGQRPARPEPARAVEAVPPAQDDLGGPAGRPEARGGAPESPVENQLSVLAAPIAVSLGPLSRTPLCPIERILSLILIRRHRWLRGCARRGAAASMGQLRTSIAASSHPMARSAATSRQGLRTSEHGGGR